MTSCEHVFSIPEMRLIILSYYMDKYPNFLFMQVTDWKDNTKFINGTFKYRDFKKTVPLNWDYIKNNEINPRDVFNDGLTGKC